MGTHPRSIWNKVAIQFLRHSSTIPVGKLDSSAVPSLSVIASHRIKLWDEEWSRQKLLNGSDSNAPNLEHKKIQISITDNSNRVIKSTSALSGITTPKCLLKGKNNPRYDH